MIKNLLAGILFSAMIIPGNVYAASDLETKKAIESFYDEDGFMNKIWACELISRAFNTTGGREFTTKARHKFAVTQYMSDEYYRELTDYLDSSPKTADQWANDPLTERIFHTILGELQAEPMNQDKYDVAFMYCTLSMSDFSILNMFRRVKPSIYVDSREALRKQWVKHIAEYPAPKIASGPIGKSKTIAPSTKPIAQTTSSESSHERCLAAKDYEGCMRVQSSGGTAAPIGDKCTAKGACVVTTKGTDSFGLPKPMGWFYKDDGDGSRIIYFSKFHRVPHNGQPTRYVGVKRITRYYQNPKAGTSGTVIGGGTGFTNCTGYGSSINCTTTGGGSRYIPGQSATPGGVKNARFDSVYDCKDDTHANYEGTRIMYGGWTKNSKSSWAKLLKGVCDRGPDYIMKLDTMNVQM